MPGPRSGRGRSFLERRLQLLKPRRRSPVARRAPVAAGAQGAAGGDLGGVGAGAALVLAELEEAQQEDLEPFADRGEVVGALLAFRIVVRPLARLGVAPRAVGEEGDLGRRLARAQD